MTLNIKVEKEKMEWKKKEELIERFYLSTAQYLNTHRVRRGEMIKPLFKPDAPTA
jgi:hypothetical protein